VSAAGEPDAGARYPTLIQDCNGNQIIVKYLAGGGGTTPDSSARIQEIRDARAVDLPSGRRTYSFLYGTGPIPHLLAISSHIGTAESYQFSYGVQSVRSPFDSHQDFGLVRTLTGVTDSAGLSHLFTYNAYAEMTDMVAPHGGTIAWDYGTFQFLDRGAVREVESREVVLLPGQRPLRYTLDRDPGDSHGVVHASAVLREPEDSGQRVWSFCDDASSPDLGLATAFEVRSAHGHKPLQRKEYTWSRTIGGAPYIGNIVTTVDPEDSEPKSARSEFVRDSFGNLVESRVYEFGDSLTPAKTHRFEYLRCDRAGRGEQQRSGRLGDSQRNPRHGPDLETRYSYNVLGKLSGVTMPRPEGTQQQEFTYDSGGRLLTRKHAESGPDARIYNADGTLATRTDAKGQCAVYGYDSYKRLVSVDRYGTDGALDQSQCVRYYYDANPLDPSFSQNVQGRLAAVRWGVTGVQPGQITEMYSYTPAGGPAGKRLRINRGEDNLDLDIACGFDAQGRVASLAYPGDGQSYTYSYDAAGRPARLSSGGVDLVKQAAVLDRLGSVRARASAKNGGQGHKALYFPFGEEAEPTPDDREKFGSYTRDSATGLDYAEQRYYSSTHGRFLTLDPCERSVRLTDPESWNRYSFVGNDPINRADPHGTCWYECGWSAEDVDYYYSYGGSGPAGTTRSA
jgi:RHS repeat-associated protein